MHEWKRSRSRTAIGVPIEEIKPCYDPTEPLPSVVTWFHSREWQELLFELGSETRPLAPLGDALEKERQQMLARITQEQSVEPVEAPYKPNDGGMPPPHVTNGVCALIMQGVFPWVAANAYGVSKAQLKRLEETNEDIANAILTAHGTARASAEARVFASNPEFWLKYGPGKQKPDAPGWGEERAITGAEGTPLPSQQVTVNQILIQHATDDELERMEELYKRMEERAGIVDGNLTKVE